MPMASRLFSGDIESIQYTISFGDSENHFGKSLDLFGLNDARYIHQSELLERMFVKIDIG